MSQLLDIGYIESKVTEILERAHSDSKKRKYKLSHDRIRMACPICGDSHKNNAEKRGHLFFNNLYYKCYNEDCRSTFTGLCKKFDISIDAEHKKNIIDYIDLNFHSFSRNDDDWIIGNLKRSISYADLDDWFKAGEGPLKGFGPVQFGSSVFCYLRDRGIPEDFIKNHFYEGIMVYQKWQEPFVVFLNKLGDKILGMQIRNLKSGPQRKFKIFTFQELYESVYHEKLDLIEAISYNKVSYLFNIMNIDFEKEITIFEGYLDSIFMPNAIGAVGVNTDFGFLINEDVKVRFFFDNDNVGKKKAEQWLKKGYTVFLWEKLINDMAKSQSDPYAFKAWFNENIKDLNAYMKIYKCSYKKLLPYFSNSIIDSIYLNYAKALTKKQKIEVKLKERTIHDYDFEKTIRLIRNGRN